ncbi:MAG: DotA/TraY family protein [Janthinobacterium lividum]
MRLFRLFLPAALLMLGATVAHAQSTTGSTPTWSSLSAGDDWAATVLHSIFPSTSQTGDASIGTEQTVIGQLLGELTGFVMILAAAFVGYTTVLQIHRAAESGRVLGNSMSSWVPVRLTFALIMMFPVSNGFSAGQRGVVLVATWGIGMARGAYTYAIQSVGPDAVPIAQPMIPGTKTIVAGLMQAELCRALINQASNNANMVPVPTPFTSPEDATTGSAGYVSWPYALAAGNSSDTPACGGVTVRGVSTGSNFKGASIDMAGTQRAILSYVLESDIRPQMEQLAQQLWSDRNANDLTAMYSILTTATADYTQQLTTAATSLTSNLRSQFGTVGDARNGSSWDNTTTNATQLSSLGWTSAGAYYLEIAKLNGLTLSILSATPQVTEPSYSGLGEGLSKDMAPLVKAALGFNDQLMNYVAVKDGQDVPGGTPDLYSGATPGADGTSLLEQVIRKLHLDERLLNAVTTALAPNQSLWYDPFVAMSHLGHILIAASLAAMGLAGLLSSTTGTAGAVAGSLLTFNFSGAAAAIGGHALMGFFATPIFYGCMALLIPGITLAFILPMVPYAYWIAGVAGWLILVCEAVVAVPLWMFAHLTFQGDGLHGKGFEGYSMLFNILFRPILMLLGLFFGYYIFVALSGLITQSFGIAAGFVMMNGSLLTNLIGVVVFCCMFVLFQISAAMMSFRMISLFPHHVVRWVGLMAANRVDMGSFASEVGAVGLANSTRAIQSGLSGMANHLTHEGRGGSGAKDKSGKAGAAPDQQKAPDRTLQLSSSVTPPAK